jgi:hypothetical protein
MNQKDSDVADFVCGNETSWLGLSKVLTSRQDVEHEIGCVGYFHVMADFAFRRLRILAST